MLLSLLSLVLVLTTHTVLSLPRLHYSNLHYLPPEDQVGDWSNPWTFSPTFPRVVPPSSDIMANFGLTPTYRGLSHHRHQEDLKPVDLDTLITDGRDLNRVAVMR